MNWTPRKFNDTLALWVFTTLLAVDVWLIGFSGTDKEILTFILGAQFGWIGTIVMFYFRKKEGQ